MSANKEAAVAADLVLFRLANAHDHIETAFSRSFDQARMNGESAIVLYRRFHFLLKDNV